MVLRDFNPQISLSLMLKGVPLKDPNQGNVKKQEAKLTSPQSLASDKTRDQVSVSSKPVGSRSFEDRPVNYQELREKMNILEDFYLFGNPDPQSIRIFANHYLPEIIKQIEKTPNITEGEKKDSYRAIFFTSLKVLGQDRDLQLSKRTIENLGEKDDRYPDGNLRQIWQAQINEADANRGT